MLKDKTQDSKDVPKERAHEMTHIVIQEDSTQRGANM